MNAGQGEKLFARFNKGRLAALPELLELEKVDLFDYLIRMTGSITLATDTIDDVYVGLADGGQYDFRTYRSFRTCLFVTARKFNADKWNAETSRLENPAFSQPEFSEELSASDQQSYRALDRSLRRLAGRMREAVVLKERCRFHDDDIATIMELPRAEVESLYLKGMQQIDAECSGVVEQPEKKIGTMPRYPAPEQTAAVTMDLSMVMAGIHQKPTGLRSPLRILLVVLLLGFGVGSFLYPELLEVLGLRAAWDYLQNLLAE